VDVQGVESLRAQGIDALYVFVKAPSPEALTERLRGRGDDGEAAIRARLEAAEDEMEQAKDYELVLVNDDIERAARELADALGVKLTTPAEGRS
jgi:guanylate kinase